MQYYIPSVIICFALESTQGLFDPSNYRSFILPIVFRIFPVRDAQIRLVLLHYFPHYIGLMGTDQLVQNILPEVKPCVEDNTFVC